jgi:hypothetical protein
VIAAFSNTFSADEAAMRLRCAILPVMCPLRARVLNAVQAPFKRTLLADKTTMRHGARPSWYAASTEDRTIDPDLERIMAKRMGATLSRPFHPEA